MTVTQMKYLIELAPKKDGRPVSLAEIARRFDVNRSTISRALAGLVDEGILDEQLAFTTYGKSFMMRFSHIYENLVYWLTRNGINEDAAGEDALNIMMNCSDETISLMEQGGDFCKACDYFGENGHKLIVDGNSLSRYIPKGDYRVAFAFCKGRKRDPQQISMANEAFHHPAVMTVRDNESYMRIKCRKVEQKSMKDMELMSGEMKSMRYEYRNRIKSAEVKNGYVTLPLEAMQFSLLQDEDMIRGEMKLFLSSSVGEIHMPECTALLRVFV